MTTTPATVGTLLVVPLQHPQGCRTYVVADPESKQALAIDVHLDLVDQVIALVHAEHWTLRYVVDTHTHADHPSGAGRLAAKFESTRVAHVLMSIEKHFQEYFDALERSGNKDRCWLCCRWRSRRLFSLCALASPLSIGSVRGLKRAACATCQKYPRPTCRRKSDRWPKP